VGLNISAIDFSIEMSLTLKDATELLGDTHARYFVAVYEEFKFKDTDGLKDYVDFILHEPVEWIKGFPLKLRTRLSFSKPKVAVIRLLKVPEVITALSQEYCSKAHDVVWTTFKKHGDAILNSRVKKGFVGAGEATETTEAHAVEEENDYETPPPLLTNKLSMNKAVLSGSGSGSGSGSTVVADDEPLTTIHTDWKRKFTILAASYRALIYDAEVSHSMSKAMLILLEALESGA
jgi:hypothetical protein